MPADSGAASERGQVRWLPLESNPDVMNSFLYNLGLSQKWAVTDVFGLEPELLAMVPQPVTAVLLLYPLTETAVTASTNEDNKIKAEGQVVSPKVYFMRQTIGNACGTVALMHALANNQETLQLGSGPLAEFFSKTAGQSPEERALSLEKFQQLEAAHEAAGHEGQTEAPSRDDRLDTHFIAFVQVDQHLYELDGRRPAPVNHGPSSPESFLSDAAKVVKSFMERDPSEVNFSVLALATSQLQLGGGPLAEFFSKTAGQTPEERALSLEKFQQLEAAHEAAGHEGQTEAPSRDDRLDTHFIAFVQVDQHLYELDGRRPAPVNHGPSSPESFLADAAKVVKSFMERDPSEVNFSVLALATSQ